MEDPRTAEQMFRAYLWRQLGEFTDGQKKIYDALNIMPPALINPLLAVLVKQIWIYYPEYECNSISRRQLENFLKKEIRMLLVLGKWAVALRASSLPDNPQRIQNQVETLLNYAKPIFLNFDSREEFINIFNSARYIANLRTVRPAEIFLNQSHYGELMRRLYPTKQALRKKLDGILTIFSMEKILEKLILPELASFADEKMIDKVLDEKRKELDHSPQKQQRLRELRLVVESVITDRMNEISP